MARFRDVSHVLRTIGVISFGKRVWNEIQQDNVFTWGAALAYSWIFAVFPFLVFLLSLVPLLPDKIKPDVRQDAHQIIDKSLPSSDAGGMLKKQVDNVLDKPSAGGFLSFGLLLTIWAASGGMAMTMYAMDKAYDIEDGRPYVKRRLVAIFLTLVVATLLILVLLLMPIGTGVIKWMTRYNMLDGWAVLLLDLARYTVSFGLMFVVLALIYHFGPSFRQKFQPVTPGAVFTVAVWILLGILFRVYMTNFGGAVSYNKTYGAVAGAVILLLFFYIDAVVLLIGAEINSEIDFAVLGLPSGGVAPREAAAKAAPRDTEQQALAGELQEKRTDPITPSLTASSITRDGHPRKDL